MLQKAQVAKPYLDNYNYAFSLNKNLFWEQYHSFNAVDTILCVLEIKQE